MRPSLESDTDAVRAAAVAFAGANPKADRKEIAAYLKTEGFGNSRFPIKRWISEAQDAAGQVPDEYEIVAEDGTVVGTGPLADHGAATRKREFTVTVPAEVLADPAPEKAKKAPKSKYADLSNEDLAAKLLASTTVPDRVWPDRQTRPRNKGESRSDYIKRQLLGAPEAHEGEIA